MDEEAYGSLKKSFDGRELASVNFWSKKAIDLKNMLFQEGIVDLEMTVKTIVSQNRELQFTYVEQPLEGAKLTAYLKNGKVFHRGLVRTSQLFSGLLEDEDGYFMAPYKGMSYFYLTDDFASDCLQWTFPDHDPSREFEKYRVKVKSGIIEIPSYEEMTKND